MRAKSGCSCRSSMPRMYKFFRQGVRLELRPLKGQRKGPASGEAAGLWLTHGSPPGIHRHALKRAPDFFFPVPARRRHSQARSTAGGLLFCGGPLAALARFVEMQGGHTSGAHSEAPAAPRFRRPSRGLCQCGMKDRMLKMRSAPHWVKCRHRVRC